MLISLLSCALLPPDEIRAAFEVHGTVTECTVWPNQKAHPRKDGSRPLAAFIQFTSAASAKAARDAMHLRPLLRGKELDMAAEEGESFRPTPPLIVDHAQKKTEGGGGGGGGGGYGGGYGGPSRYDDRDRYGSRSGGGRDDYPRDDRRYDDRRGYASHSGSRDESADTHTDTTRAGSTVVPLPSLTASSSVFASFAFGSQLRSSRLRFS